MSLQDLSNRESLHCIQTVFTILSGQGVCLCVCVFYITVFDLSVKLPVVCIRRCSEHRPAELLLSALQDLATAPRRSADIFPLQIKPLKLSHCELTAACCLPGAPCDDIRIVLQCLDTMLIRRKKQVTLQRAMAFMKRLSMLSMHVLPNASVGLLAAGRASMHVSVYVCALTHHTFCLQI